MTLTREKEKLKDMTDRDIKIKLGLIPFWMDIANKIKDPKARKEYIKRMKKRD